MNPTVEYDWIVIFLDRNPSYYFWNGFFPLFLIGCAALSCVAIPTDNFSSRSSLITTVLLTGVAFKLSMNSYVAVLKYQTFLDIFAIVSLVLIILCLVESLIVTMIPTGYLEDITLYRNVPTESYEVDIQYLDRYIYLVLFLLWFVFFMVFG